MWRLYLHCKTETNHHRVAMLMLFPQSRRWRNGGNICVKSLLCRSLTGDNDEWIKSLTNQQQQTESPRQTNTEGRKKDQEGWKGGNERVKWQWGATMRDRMTMSQGIEREGEMKGVKDRGRARARGRQTYDTLGTGTLIKDTKGKKKRQREGWKWGNRWNKGEQMRTEREIYREGEANRVKGWIESAKVWDRDGDGKKEKRMWQVKGKREKTAYRIRRTE